MRASIRAAKGLAWQRILVVEDDAATNKRRRLIAIGGSVRHRVNVRLHSVTDQAREVVGQRAYQAGKLAGSSKAEIALRLVDEQRPFDAGVVVVAGATYGANKEFIQGLIDRGLSFVVEVRPSELLSKSRWKKLSRRHVATKINAASWRTVQVAAPTSVGSGNSGE